MYANRGYEKNPLEGTYRAKDNGKYYYYGKKVPTVPMPCICSRSTSVLATHDLFFYFQQSAQYWIGLGPLETAILTQTVPIRDDQLWRRGPSTTVAS